MSSKGACRLGRPGFPERYRFLGFRGPGIGNGEPPPIRTPCRGALATQNPMGNLSCGLVFGAPVFGMWSLAAKHCTSSPIIGLRSSRFSQAWYHPTRCRNYNFCCNRTLQCLSMTGGRAPIKKSEGISGLKTLIGGMFCLRC